MANLMDSLPVWLRPTDIFAAQRQDLERLGAANRSRTLVGRTGRDFSSNDYLGLAGSPTLTAAVAEALERGVPIGSGGSRLLRGNDPEHVALEEEAAAFFRCETTLYFATGYAANTTLFSTLPQRGDLVVHDALVHASAHEGLRLSRANTVSALHNDAQAFDDALSAWRRQGGTGRGWIAVESLYSMDGDRAPLDDLVTVADRHDAILMIDEAHATGIFGEQGRGLSDRIEGHDNVITLRTCGKAMGCEGALVCGPAIVRDSLINRGRGFIFSTAPSPLMAAAVRAALQVLRDQPERRRRLWELIDYAHRVLEPLGVTVSGSQIMPLEVGDDAATMELAAALQQAGLDVRGIRPPTVPVGTSRLRISLTLNIYESDIDALSFAIQAARR